MDPQFWGEQHAEEPCPYRQELYRAPGSSTSALCCSLPSFLSAEGVLNLRPREDKPFLGL